jgi:hypothetical protein
VAITIPNINQLLYQPVQAIPRRVKQGTMEGIAIGATSRFSLIKGPSYHGVFLRFTASGAETTKANIEADAANVKVIVDGTTFVEAKPSYLNKLLDYYGVQRGITSRNGYLYIDFAGVHLDRANQYGMAWGTKNVGQIVIEVKARTGAALNYDTIEVFPVYDDILRNLGIHRKIRVFSENLGSAAVDDVTDLPKDPNMGYSAIHVTPGSGTIKQVTFKADNQDYFLEEPLTLLHLEAERLGRTPQTGWAHLDWNVSDKALQMFPMSGDGRRVGDLRLKPDFTGGAAPNAYDIILETIEGFGSL